MTNLDIKLNSNIEIMYDDKTYRTTVQHVDDEEFGFTIISENGLYLLLNVGYKLEVKMYSDTCIYLFDSIITRRSSSDDEENIPMFYLSFPKEIKRVQRRKFVRAFFTEEFTFFLLNEGSLQNPRNIALGISSQEAKKGIVLDMSGGGLRFISKEVILENSMVLLDIKSGKNNVLVEGRIMWAKEEDNKRMIYGVNFENIPEFERDKIINKTFDIIRRQRRIKYID